MEDSPVQPLKGKVGVLECNSAMKMTFKKMQLSSEYPFLLQHRVCSTFVLTQTFPPSESNINSVFKMSQGSRVNAVTVWPNSVLSALSGDSPLTSSSLVHKKGGLNSRCIKKGLLFVHQLKTKMWNPKCCVCLKMSHAVGNVSDEKIIYCWCICLVVECKMPGGSILWNMSLFKPVFVVQTHATLFLPRHAFESWFPGK